MALYLYRDADGSGPYLSEIEFEQDEDGQWHVEYGEHLWLDDDPIAISAGDSCRVKLLREDFKPAKGGVDSD